MHFYRLVKDAKEERFLILVPLIVSSAFFLVGLVGLFCMWLIDVSYVAFFGVSVFFALVMALASIPNVKAWGLHATLEGDVLTIYTHKKKMLRSFSLREMNLIFALVGYGRYQDPIRNRLILYHKTVDIKFRHFKWHKLPVLEWNCLSPRKQSQIVLIANKELEEKILAYYGEPITEPDSTV